LKEGRDGMGESGEGAKQRDRTIMEKKGKKQ
jgi:hypothetical protein